MGMYISDIVNVMSGSPKCCGTVLVLKVQSSSRVFRSINSEVAVDDS